MDSAVGVLGWRVPERTQGALTLNVDKLEAERAGAQNLLQSHGQGQVPTKVALFGECHALPGLLTAGKGPPAGCRASPTREALAIN